MKKPVLLVVVVAFLILLLLAGLRGLGVFDLNYFKSEVATNRTGISELTSPPGAESR